jgi:hypothetical protein
MDAAERELFAKGIQDAVGRGDGLDAALAELGWADALAADERTAVSVLFEAQGGAAATSGALDLLLARSLLTPELATDSGRLRHGSVASSEGGGVVGVAVVLPAFGLVTPPGELAGGAATVAGFCRTDPAGPLLVACATGDGGLALATVDGLDRRVIGGLDPDLGLVEVAGRVPATDNRALDPAIWAAAVAAGQRAIAHELVGAAAQMLELAREHALDRIQFGVPIATFQAVRHKLAETYVAIEGARAALDAAWDDPSPFDATVAKATAGRSARLAAKHCQQVLAGIGFTTEHPFHRYARRVRALDGLLGDTRSLTRTLGEQLLAQRELPPILPL